MMRKDVKLGLAIGGVLLAVIVVYVLVGTGTGAGEKTVAANNPANNSSSNPAAVVTEDHSSAPGVSVATDSHKPIDGAAPGNSSIANSTNQADPNPLASAGNGEKHDANTEMWGSVLEKGLMTTQTPSAASTSTDVPGGGVSEPKNTDGAAANAPAKTATPDSLTGGPSTQPSDSLAPGNDSNAASSAGVAANGAMTSSDSTAGATHQRTHVVQKGETLASISQMAYGSANFFPAIQRANPKLDPKKLKPGMTIILPPVSDVKPDPKSDARSSAEHASGNNMVAEATTPASTGSSKDTYRVASGDTLERIAIKLYGKREMKDKIYELNKDAIGADPNKLKLNQLLKLPSPPTTSR